MRVGPLLRFVKERWDIYLKKDVQGLPKPWTRDPILQNYRFTQVYRELDKVTVWIAQNWRGPHEYEEDVWFALCVARYINWPYTLHTLGYPIPWSSKLTCKILNSIAGKQTVRRYMAKSHKETPHKIERIQTQMSNQVFGGAYFLNSIGPKIESIVNDRLNPLWKNRRLINTKLAGAETLQQIYEVFRAQHGFGSFMAAQIVADLKYTPRFNAERMPDWWTWAASGPGSRRGLNRLCERPVNAPWNEAEWHEKLLELQRKVNARIVDYGMPLLHAQDVQGICCCEWDKYERARLGEGRPKTKYPGAK